MNLKQQSYNGYKEFLESAFLAEQGSPSDQIVEMGNNSQDLQDQINGQIMQPHEGKSKQTFPNENEHHQPQISNHQVTNYNINRPFSPKLPQSHNQNIVHSCYSQNIPVPQNKFQQLGSYEHPSMIMEQKNEQKLTNKQAIGNINKYRRSLHIIDQKTKINNNQSNKLFPKTKRRKLTTQAQTQVSFNLSFNEESMAKYRKILADFDLIKDQQKQTDQNPKDRQSLSPAKDVLADLHQKRQYNFRNGRGQSLYRSLNKHSLYESAQKNQERIIVFIKTYVYSHLQSVSIEISLLSDTLMINCKLIGKVNQMLKLVLDEQKAERLYKESFNDWEVLGKRISIQTTQSGIKYLRILSLRQLIVSLKSQLQPDDLNDIQASQRKAKLKKLKQKMKQQEFIKRNYFSFIEKNQSRLDNKSEAKIHATNDGAFNSIDHVDKLNNPYLQPQNEKQKSNKKLIGNARKKLSRLTKHLDYLSPDVKDKVISIREDYLKDLANDKDSKQKSQNEEFVKRIRRLFERLSKPKQTLKPIEKRNDIIVPSKPQIMIQKGQSRERKEGKTARQGVNAHLLRRQNIRNSQKLTKLHYFSSQLSNEPRNNNKKQPLNRSYRKNSFRQLILKKEFDKLKRSESGTQKQTQNDNWMNENMISQRKRESIEEQRQTTEMQGSSRLQEDGIEGENNKVEIGSENGIGEIAEQEIGETQVQEFVDQICQSQQKEKQQQVEYQIQSEDKNESECKIQYENENENKNQCQNEIEDKNQRKDMCDEKIEAKSEAQQIEDEQIEDNEESYHNDHEDDYEIKSNKDIHDVQQQGSDHKQSKLKENKLSMQMRDNDKNEHIPISVTSIENYPSIIDQLSNHLNNDDLYRSKQNPISQLTLIDNKQSIIVGNIQSSPVSNDQQQLKENANIKVNDQIKLERNKNMIKEQEQVKKSNSKLVDLMQINHRLEKKTQREKQLEDPSKKEDQIMSIKMDEQKTMHIDQAQSVSNVVAVQDVDNIADYKPSTGKYHQQIKHQSTLLNQTETQTQTKEHHQTVTNQQSPIIKRQNSKQKIISNVQTLSPPKQISSQPVQTSQITPTQNQLENHQPIVRSQTQNYSLKHQQTMPESHQNFQQQQQVSKNHTQNPIEIINTPNNQSLPISQPNTQIFQKLKKSQQQILQSKTQTKHSTIQTQQQNLKQKTQQSLKPKSERKLTKTQQNQYERSNTKQQSIGDSKSKTLFKQSNQQIFEKYEVLEPHFNLNAKFILIEQSQISQFLKNFYQSISPLEVQMLPYTKEELQKIIRTNLSLNKTIDFFNCNSLGWFQKQKRKYLLLGSLECVHLIAQKYGAIQIQTFRIFKKESIQQRKYLMKYIKDFEKFGFLYQKKMKTEGLYEIKGIIKVPKQILSKNFSLPQKSLKFTSIVSIDTPLAQPKDKSLEIEEKHNKIFWHLLGDCLINELTSQDLQKYIDSCKAQSKSTELFTESLKKQSLSGQVSPYIFREHQDTFSLEINFDPPYVQIGKQTFLSFESNQYNLGTNNEKIYLASQNDGNRMDNKISQKLLIFEAQKSIIKENYLEAYLMKKINEINNSKPQKRVHLFVPSFNIKSNLRMTENDDFKKSFIHRSNIVCDLLPSSISVFDSLPNENRKIIELKEQNRQKGFVFCVCSCMGDRIEQVMAGSWIGHKDLIIYDQFS